MKLHTNTNTITKSENFVESNYKIDATAKAFAILSDGLYSNKILAVVRELSTNAYDSHVAAGCPERTFDVHLPTPLDNEFSIRDYGTGLSKEDCMSLYTTYFRSDKTDSNDAVGCLGLGSKSPFAYTDQFMVESFYNGNHMTFSAYKNENDEPVFALLSEQSTDEPNGLKVSFATDSSDTYAFKHEAQNVWKYFVTTPNTNIDVEVVSQGDATMSGEDWQISTKANRGYGKNELVMGQIGYELDADQFEDDVYDLLWRGYGLTVYVNIGDVDITPSRESLSYNSRTKEFVHNKIKNILEEISTQTQQYIDDSPTLWDARLAWTGVNKNMSGVKTIREAIGEITHYKNQELFSAESWCGVDLPESTKAGNNVVWYTKSKYRTTVQRQEISVLKVFSRADMTIIYENEKKGSVGRVKHHLKEVKQEGNMFLIRGDEDYLEEVLTAMGANRDHVIDVTTLAKPPRNASSSSSSGGGYKRCEVLRCNDSGWFRDPSSVSVKEQNVFFLESSRDDYFINGKSLDWYRVKELLNSLTEVGADVDVLAGRLYVFTPSTVKSMKLRERSNWTDASELLTTEIRYQLELNKDDITAHESSDKNNWTTGNKSYNVAVSSLEKVSQACETHGELGDFISKARPDVSEGLKGLVSSAKKIGIYATFLEKLETVVLDIDDMYDTIIEYYPMLKIAGRWIDDEDIKMVAEYIDSINRGEK